MSNALPPPIPRTASTGCCSMSRSPTMQVGSVGVRCKVVEDGHLGNPPERGQHARAPLARERPLPAHEEDSLPACP